MTEAEFNALADQGYNRIPVTVETFADLDTPLSVYLKLANVPNTYLLRVSLEGSSGAGLAEVINAVCATFIERMKSEQIYGADERTRHLLVREQELLTLIAAKAVAGVDSKDTKVGMELCWGTK